MPRAYASALIPAPVEQVWQTIRAFDGLAGWHPTFEASTLDSGASAEAGAIRRLTLGGGGGTVVERLLAIDDLDHRFTYEILESPFPIRRYASTTQLVPVTDTGQTFGQWWAEFDAEGADEAELITSFSGLYADGFAALRKRFA